MNNEVITYLKSNLILIQLQFHIFYSIYPRLLKAHKAQKPTPFVQTYHLADESSDLSQAEKKTIFVKAEQIHKMIIILTQKRSKVAILSENSSNFVNLQFSYIALTTVIFSSA